MSEQAARQLLRDYCTPVNWLSLIHELADEKKIPRKDVQKLIDSGEYGIGEYNGIWMIRKSLLYVPPIPKNKMGIDRNTLLQAVDAGEVFGNEIGVTLKDTSGKWQSTPCPFHDDDKPSFGILLPIGAFNCLGCGERGGNPIDFVMALHCLTFPKAIDYLASNYTTIRSAA